LCEFMYHVMKGSWQLVHIVQKFKKKINTFKERNVT